MNIFLDTSAIIAYFKEDKDIKDEIDNADEVYSSALCVFEALLGEEYAKLRGFKPKHDVAAFFGGLTIVPFNEEDGRKAAEVQAFLATKGTVVNGMDVLIASSAHRINATIVAKDHDYELISKVLGLSLRIV